MIYSVIKKIINYINMNCCNHKLEKKLKKKDKLT